jgi:hypothetical protein
MNNQQIKMDLEDSVGATPGGSRAANKLKHQTTEETVEVLMAKLEQKGKKVQILEPG